MTTAASWIRPRGAVTEGGVVGDQAGDVGDGGGRRGVRRHRGGVSPSGGRAGRSWRSGRRFRRAGRRRRRRGRRARRARRVWAPSRTTAGRRRPCAARPPRSRRIRPSRRRAGAAVPRCVTESSAIVVRSASAPVSMRARVVPAQGGVAVGGGGAQQRGGRPVAAGAGAQPLVELHRAGLFEQVDDGVAVAAEGERASRARWSAGGRADAVGEVAFGGRAHAGAGAGAAEQGDVLVGEVGVVDGRWCAGRGRRGRRGAGWGCGRAPSRQASFSAVCSERWTWSGARRSCGPLRRRCASWSAGTARTEWMAAPIRA